MLTRFAPSPTGRLHLGHAYAALVARELADRKGGSSLLRFEDIDHSRIRTEFYALIEEDLQWLGLTWEGEALREASMRGSHVALAVRPKLLPTSQHRQRGEQTSRLDSTSHSNRPRREPR